jgi:hypothetical protein
MLFLPASFFGLEVVDPAEDHGQTGEQPVLVVQHEVVGEVVAGDDQVELRVPELVAIEREEGLGALLRGEALGVHVLNLQVHQELGLGEVLPEAGDDLVGPGVAVVVGVEHQHVLAGLFGQGRGKGETGKQDRQGQAQGETLEHVLPPWTLAADPVGEADRAYAPGLWAVGRGALCCAARHCWSPVHVCREVSPLFRPRSRRGAWLGLCHPILTPAPFSA